METTEIAASKTSSEVTTCLVIAGARQIAMDYDGSGSVTGMRFCMMAGGALVAFSLPVRTRPIFEILNGRRKYSHDRDNCKDRDMAQAERVAWRQLLRWIQAQVAMIQTNMVKPEEVFLPYMLHGQSGRTLFEHFQGGGFRQITGGVEQ